MTTPTSPAAPSPRVGSLGRALGQAVTRYTGAGFVVAALMVLGGALVILPLAETLADVAGRTITLWIIALLLIALFWGAVAAVVLVPPFLLGAADRRALVVHSWIGAREVRRVLGSASRVAEIPTTPAAAAEWLDRTPDTDSLRPLRFEMAVMAGRYDQARETLTRLPASTPLDRYRQREGEALVDDQEHGIVDLGAVRAALSEVDGPDAAEAAASFAIFDARRHVDDGTWRERLGAVRPLIREGDVRILVRDHGRPLLEVLERRAVRPLALLILAMTAVLTVVWNVPR
ncbi:MAG: hypothetical protein ACJ761_00245 [Chloroflexota bacterium]